MSEDEIPPSYLEELDSQDEQRKYDREAYLRKKGWHHSSNYPAALWLWSIDRGDLSLKGVSFGIAIHMQKHWDDEAIELAYDKIHFMDRECCGRCIDDVDECVPENYPWVYGCGLKREGDHVTCLCGIDFEASHPDSPSCPKTGKPCRSSV